MHAVERTVVGRSDNERIAKAQTAADGRRIEIQSARVRPRTGIGDFQISRRESQIGRIAPILGFIIILVNVALVQIRQDFGEPAFANGIVRRRSMVAGKIALGVVVSVQRQADLLEVVGAGRTVGRLAHILYRRQKQGGQYADDGDHHQEFNQSKAHTSILLEENHGELLQDVSPDIPVNNGELRGKNGPPCFG